MLIEIYDKYSSFKSTDIELKKNRLQIFISTEILRKVYKLKIVHYLNIVASIEIYLLFKVL